MTEGEHAASEDTADTASAPPQWLRDIGEAVGALRELAQAQWQLLEAELRVARSAAWTLLVVSVLVLVLAAALGLTLLALVGLALSLWLGSWIWALLVLAGLLVLGLIATLMLGRRCLHWLSLPGTRTQWRAFTDKVGTASSRAGARPEQ